MIPGEFQFVRDSGGDWMALYRDGRLVYEGHDLPAWKLLEVLKCNVKPTIEVEVDPCNLGDAFPELLEDLPDGQTRRKRPRPDRTQAGRGQTRR